MVNGTVWNGFMCACIIFSLFRVVNIRIRYISNVRTEVHLAEWSSILLTIIIVSGEKNNAQSADRAL